MTVLAKDAKAGQWYKDRNGRRCICVGGDKRFVREVGDVFCLWNNEELDHLPDCTGWDWQPPKPEKKYRPFANAAEFAPHRGRWVYLLDDPADQLLICSFGDLGIFYLQSLTTWEAMFSQAKFADDGTPFGVEVTE
jgi:hypothetical protein